jgi:hypothetical protein
MLDHVPPPPGFYDVLNVEDPSFRRAEALSFAVQDVLADDADKPIVRVAALAALIVAYMRNAPAEHRNALTQSLVDDITTQVADA